MIISVEKLKQYVTTDKTDEVLEAMLQALELSIRNYTNNNFQKRGFRVYCAVTDGVFKANGTIPFKVGETVQISESVLNDGLYTIATVDNGTFTVNEEVVDDTNMLITKVEYPVDVKTGVVDIIDWKLRNKDTAGLTSETISRHSRTFDRASMSKEFGVPNELIGFLKYYRCAKR